MCNLTHIVKEYYGVYERDLQQINSAHFLGIFIMKKLALSALLSALFATAAFAGGGGMPPPPQMPTSSSSSANGSFGAGGAIGLGVFSVTNNATSSVNGGYAASLNGPGSNAGTFNAGNESFANTSVTFGTNAGFTNSSNTANTNEGNGNNTTSASSGLNNFTNSGFSVASSTGSQDFGSSIYSASGWGQSNQGGWVTANGSATANADGFVGELGAGFGGFGSFNSGNSSSGQGSPW
jgi:hypothetical protein